MLGALLMGAGRVEAQQNRTHQNAKEPLRVTAQPLAERDFERRFAVIRDLKNYFEVRCTVTNTSPRVQTFTTSGYAEWMDWRTSNPSVFVPSLIAKTVAIGHVTLRAGERYEYVLPLTTRNAGRVGQMLSFRVGFFIAREHKVLWSDSVSVRVRKEWEVQRKPVSAF